MVRIDGWFLVASVVLNILFVSDVYLGYNQKRKKLSWSHEAAEEAEVVASISCSGHGSVYLDGLIGFGGGGGGDDDDGKGKSPVCECNSCYGGSDCSQFIPDCVANANGGDPLVLEPFWVQNAVASAVLVAGWHRMSYSFNVFYISPELEKIIREVHAIARNAVTQGRYIVLGVGSTQLLTAAIYALSIRNSSSPSPSRVVSQVPYYSLYKEQTDFFESDRFEFDGDALLMKNNSNVNTTVIELVTSPNNPDCQLRNPVLQGPSISYIYDRAYYWPHFTAIPAPADEDLMIFTISKLTGHAGSRLGWAIIKDKDVYERMSTYITMAELSVPKETQLRALKLLRVVVEGDGRAIFDFSYSRMSDRWEKLTQIMSLSNRFSLQKIEPQYCAFYERVREASPAYAWLKCEWEEDSDCYAVLLAAKITGRQGGSFGAASKYVRLSLLRSDDDFNILLHRLKELVSHKDGNEAI